MREFVAHEYQKRAFRWVLDHPRCLLFLEMGLGKTVVTLSAIKRLQLYGEAEKVLVIAPAKVAESTWSSEAEEWAHLQTLRVSNVTGTATQRERALALDADVYVISRDSVAWLCERYKKKFPFDMVVIDELTSFKNPKAIRFKALKRVLPQVHRVVGLTGTPTPNGYPDLWAQVYCIDQGQRLGKYISHYYDRWFNVIQLPNGVPIRFLPKDGAKAEIMEAISDIALAMRTEDWLKLPPILYEDTFVTLPDAVMKKYRKFASDKVLEITKDGKPLTAESAGVLVNKLAQFSNGAIYDEDRNVVPLHEEKLRMLREIYESERNSPILVFYQYKHDAERILNYFNGLKKKGEITGNFQIYTNDEDRRNWNHGGYDLLLAHPAATAYGLNMQQGGCRIVWFTTGWDLERYKQANARLHRQGQKRPVKVFNLVMKGTVDERMLAALSGKDSVQSAVMLSLAKGVIKDLGLHV